ncbi:hypothetical protein ACFLSQ_02255 [Bacteroidota bacterium]
MKRIMEIRLVIAVTVLVSMMGCGSLSDKIKSDCISQNMSEMTLRWGGHNYKTNHLAGYQIDANLNLYKFVKGSSTEYKTEEIGKVDNDRFCELLKTTKKLFIEIQALNAPGDSSNFVELINPGTNTNLRAVWNVRFKTHGSKEFRALFDSLDLFVINNPAVFLKEGNSPNNSVK